MSLRERLLERERDGRPVQVAVVGAGQMGSGLVSQMEGIPGMRAAVVVDVRPERAWSALREAGVPEAQIRAVTSPGEAAAALAAGCRAVAADLSALPPVGVEAVVEATGVPEVGARVALSAILAKQHVIMLNVETDVTVGRVLRRLARAAGVVYTLAAGDEPGAIGELVDFARTLGFTVVAAGKGKNNPFDPEATAESVAEEARAKGASPKMFASFVDGTKTMVEMTAVANATGLVPERRGMAGRRATVPELARIYSLREQGGELDSAGVVDYVFGVDPGVFVVVTSDRLPVQRDMEYLKLGPGPNWVLYRPYHLANLEVPISVARAVFLGEATLAPGPRPMAEAVAVAKRDLRAGDVLDGLGGSTVRGVIERAEVAREEGLLPVGLAMDAVVLRPVRKGSALRLSDVRLREDSAVVALRRIQDFLDAAAPEDGEAGA